MCCTYCDVRSNKLFDEITTIFVMNSAPRLFHNLSFTSLMLFSRPGRLQAREVTDHEEQVPKPEGKPDRRDDTKPNQEQDQSWRQEHRRVTEKPEAIRSPSLQGSFRCHSSVRQANTDSSATSQTQVRKS